MEKLVDGIRRFQSLVVGARKEWYEQLKNGQSPLALFITCVDSRVNPNLITQTEPGEICILRNAGNIIPPYISSAYGEAAAIEFVISELRVPLLIVCGHSHCAAMHALLDRGKVQSLPALASWLTHAEGVRQLVQDKYKGRSAAEMAVATVEENVLVQLDNVRTHPTVAHAVAQGNLQLYGWVYHIETGQVTSYDGQVQEFVPVTEKLPLPVSFAKAPALRRRP